MSLVYFNQVIEILEKAPELKSTFIGILKQMGWTAGGSALGGAVGGPLGALVLGIAGALAGYAKSDNYSSLIKVLRNLTEENKYQLERKIQELIGSKVIEDFITFIRSEVNRQLLMNMISANIS